VLRYDPVSESSKWVTVKHLSLMNEYGVNRIISLIRTRVSKIYTLSDFEQEDIEAIMIELSDNLVDDIFYNYNNYAIRDLAAASNIKSMVVDAVYATIRKAYKGAYLNFLKTTQRIQEVQQVHYSPREEKQEKNSMFGVGDYLRGVNGK